MCVEKINVLALTKKKKIRESICSTYHRSLVKKVISRNFCQISVISAAQIATEWENEKNNSHVKFRQINHSVISFINLVLFSRIFCQKCLKLNFNNIHSALVTTTTNNYEFTEF